MEWHRLFGLLLTDFFTGSPYVVEVERDLSWQQQRLDVLIVRKGEGRFDGRLPDGLEDLGPHNLLTFKSAQEPLDGWALHELIGHYVSYRKLTSPTPADLLPEADFRLYAVCARYPHNLAGQVRWEEVQPGVYDCRWGTAVVRVIVARQLPEAEHNAPLHLFAADSGRVQFGRRHYRRRSADTSTVLNQLLEKYQGEGFAMPYTMEDFLQDYVKSHFKRLTPEQKCEAMRDLPPEEKQQLAAYLLEEQAPTEPSTGKGPQKSRRKPKK
jgi:hypothetical protein